MRCDAVPVFVYRASHRKQQPTAQKWDEASWDNPDHVRTGRGEGSIELMLAHMHRIICGARFGRMRAP